MKLAITVKVPSAYNKQSITEIVRAIETSVNSLAEERLAAHYGASTTDPTTGSWAQGDFVRNSAPSEAGSSPNKYVVLGWICTVSGTPGTWLPCRVLTGN
jgi:hypothetical protein